MTPAELINFDKEPVTPSIIMVAGVGGGGSNAVNHMYELGIAQVTFMICNTDRQALQRSPVPIKVRLGENITEGLGAGNNPDRGRAAAMESIDDIVAIFRREGTRMVFITAGMGGGTGTGAAPVIAKAARDNGILTVGIVTLPFRAEGKVRAMNALEGIEQLRGNVDALLVINNENIQDIYGKLPLSEAFGMADDILATGARGIAEIITREGMVNVDFADVSTVMRDSGIALMGSGRASGESRAEQVAQAALTSPLLNHNSIVGARNILLNISWGDQEITLDEMHGIVNYIQEQTRTSGDSNIIWGAGREASLGDHIEVTIVATGFNIDEQALWEGEKTTGTAPQFVDKVHVPVNETTEGDDMASADEARDGMDEQIDRPRRPRFQPPVGERDPHAFWENGNPTPAAPPLDPQFPRSTAPGTVIELKENEIYKDLKKIEETPSYIRRAAKIVTDTPDKPVKTSRTVIKEDPAPEQQQPKGNSLFD